MTRMALGYLEVEAFTWSSLDSQGDRPSWAKDEGIWGWTWERGERGGEAF